MSQVKYLFFWCVSEKSTPEPSFKDVPQCIDTNSYSEPVNAIRQPSAGKSITVHATRKAKKPLTPPSVYTRINPSTREPCSQYMTTASS